jgi:tetratricopeptide (TPR) repeat protein
LADALGDALGDALDAAREGAPVVEGSRRASISGRRVGRGAVAVATLALVAVGGTWFMRARQSDAPRPRPGEMTRPAAAAAVDPGAFDLYVRGARLRNGGPRDRTPAEYFAEAIARDSTFAPAYAALAFERAFAGNGAEARTLVNKSLALDATLAEAHMALGVIREFREGNWDGAEAAFREAIRLNKGFAEAHHELSMLLMRRRRFAEAMRAAQSTLYLAPMSARFELGMAEVYLYSGRYDEALKAADRALAIDLRSGGAYLTKAYVYGEQRAYAKAVAAAERSIALGFDVHGRAFLGYVYAKSGRRPQALSIVDTLQQQWRDARGRLTDPDVAIGIAQVYAGLGEREQALDWLERSVGREMYASYLDIDPTFRSLHTEPRFQALLKRLGLAA